MDLKEPTPPEQCALSAALPLTREVYLAQLASGPERDFADLIRNGAEDLEASWNDVSHKVATPWDAAAGEARGAGIEVAAETTTQSLSELFRRKRVVTLLAHFAGPLVRRLDILDAPRMAAIIEAGEGEAAQMLRSERASDRTPDGLRGLCNGFIRSSGPPFRGGRYRDVHFVASESTTMAWRRQLLDEAFEGALRPGNRAELSDGLHWPHEIAACIPDEFSGIVHLALCRSSVMLDVVTAGHGGERRVLINEHALPLQWILLAAPTVYGLLREGRRNYAATWIDVVRELKRGRQ